MPAVSTLKSSRAREKRALIKEEAEAQKLLQEHHSNNLEDVIRLHLATGKILLNLETKLSRVESANEKIIEACDSNNDTTSAEQFQKELDEDAELMDAVLSRTSELKVMKEELERVRKNLETQSSNSTAHTAPISTSDVNLSNIWSQSTPGPIKPPQIDIRPFDGDVMKWREFWDQFEASVDKASYSPVDKFNYLKSKLRGDALSAISGYELSNSNYSVVVDVLKQRFGNPQLIVDAHYRSLSHLPMATNQAASLRQCYDAMERHLRSLEAVGENVNHRYFVAIISEKLPQKVLYQLYMLKGDNEEWTVPKLRQLLGKHITALEMAGGECYLPQPPIRLSNGKHFQPEGGRPPNLRPTAGGLLAGNSRHQVSKRYQPSQIKCVYCGQSHWSDECKKFATLQARKEKLRGSCYKCLQRGHLLKDCQRDRLCAHCGKSGHHRSLCVKLFPDTTQGSNTDPQNAVSRNTDVTSEPQNISQDVEEMMLSSGSQVQMQTATSEVTNSSGSPVVSVRIMLDSGSQRTYVTENLARYLNLQLKAPERLAVVTFGTEKPKYLQYRPSELQLHLKDGKQMTLNVSVVPNITGRITRAPLDQDDVAFIKSEGLDSKLADTLPTESECYPVEMLIGNDYYFDLLLTRKIELRPGLYLFQSRLGWIISGRYQIESDDSLRQPALIVNTMGIPPKGVKPTTHMLSSVDAPLFTQPNLEQFWDLESLGIKESPTTLDDDQAIAQFNKTVMFKEGRYLVTWPWKETSPDLPQNYQLAVGRLKSMSQKLSRSPELLEQYNKIIQEQLSKGVIEKVTSDSEEGPIKHYIPHHPVITPSKSTTKIRIVYDASAKTRKGEQSLNDCLYRGPVILPDLYGLLLRFRMSPVGVIADIEKAFLNVGLQVADRDVTRFLWLRDPTNINLTNNLQIYRFCRVPFGVISSPFLLGATITYHLQRSSNPIAKHLLRDIYVDNLITGVDTVEKGKQLYTDAKGVFEAASMNLREWASNSKEFIDFVPESDRVTRPNQKVLGINWNLLDDTVSVPVSSYTETKVLSKREILQRVSSIFDPLGYFTPVVLKAKLLLKKLWINKCNWDDGVNDDFMEEWELISKELEAISSYQLPRYIGIGKKPDLSIEYHLVCFCDASGLAYATTIYLHQSTGDTCKTDLIFSKTRLAPQGTTIPRLELLGVLIGVRALKFVRKELHQEVPCHLFTDSVCVLYWLKTPKPLSVFVANRVKEIKTLEAVTFCHVSSEDNPADMASRGKSPEELSSSMWWNGPLWLTKPIKEWPRSEVIIDDESSKRDSESEVKGNKVFYEAKLVSAEGPSEEHITRPDLSDFDESRHSSLYKLLRTTAWVLRFINRLRKKEPMTGPLSTYEIERAKLLWELHIQRKNFCETLENLRKGKKDNLQAQLNLHLDKNGLIRCHGRLANAELTQGAKSPKILPKKEYFTKLTVLHYHQKVLHSGVSQTLAQIRQEYWVPHGRALTKLILKSCLTCKRAEGRPFVMPEMPPLPRERVARSVPFEFTGVDYFGPLYVKQFVQMSEQDIEVVSKKVWVCLFTCLSVRAIHLEVVEDMTAEEFILCLRRFIARRGVPRQIISDNAKQFKVAKSTLNKAWSTMVMSSDVGEFSVRQGIQWKFIVELAPWMGGFYERLVGITKRALRKALGDNCLTEKQLETVVIEVETVVNTRPLVYVDDDINSSIVITPSHFLSLHSQSILPDFTGDFDSDPNYEVEKPTTAQQLLETWKRGQRRLNQFWSLWKNDYLLSLRERVQKPGQQINRSPQIGEVVLIKDNLPRSRWKVGKIVELFMGKDQRIRSAKVFVSPHTNLNRPLSLLYPIECPSTKNSDIGSGNKDTAQSTESTENDREASDNVPVEDDVTKTHSEESTTQDTDDTIPIVPSTRPTRKATVIARRKIKEWLSPEKNVCLGSVADGE